MAYLSVFLQQNSDYLYFLHGLFYILSGSVALLLYRRKTSSIPWIWFALFALGHGLHHWLSLFELNMGLPIPTENLGLAIDFLAFAAVIEFVRRVLGQRVLGYALVGVFSLLAAWHYPAQRHLIGWVLLVIPSMALGAAAFWKMRTLSERNLCSPIALLLGSHAALSALIALFHAIGFMRFGTSLFFADLVCILVGSALFGLLWVYYLRYEDDSDRLPAMTLLGALRPLFALGALILAGWFLVQYFDTHRTALLKNELLKRSQVAANSIDAAYIRSLSGTAADLGTPPYEELKHHLIHVRVVSRFLYLFAFREGEIVFIADSEPEGSPDLSPPGQIFTEATPAFVKAIRTGKPAVLDPETDRWGTWVSVIIPLPSTLSDGSPVYFGADMDAAHWMREVHNARLMGIVIVSLFCVLILYFYASSLQILRINTQLNEEIGLFTGGPSFVMKWLSSGTVRRILYTSPNIDNLLGHSADAVVSGEIPFAGLIHPEERDGFDALLRTLSSAPRSHAETEIRLRDAHGIYRWFHAFILTKNHTYALSYHAYFTDIDEQKKAELAYHKLSERLLLHFRLVPFAIIEWDTGFRVLEWNPAAEKIFGFSREEALGKKAEDLILLPRHLPETSRLMDDLVTRQGGEYSINENITKEGKIITCAWHNTHLIDENGTVIGIASVAEDITEKKEFEAKIEYLAYYDELTGLPNRVLFKDHMTLECHRSDRSHHPLAVIFLDIDFFKTINDTLGHDIGNKLLQAVAERLKHVFRSSDTLSRFGGDEFAVLLPDVHQTEDVDRMLQDLLKRINAPFTVLEHELYVTLSIGYSIYPQDGSDAETLLRNADIAMYSAKEAGRNAFRRYHSDMSHVVTNQLEIHTGLIHAFKHQEFVLHYQPQYDIAEGMVTGAEALIRWQHPQKGVIPPSEFIPIAEKTGLIVPIGEWVLRTACQELRRLENLGIGPFTMAINLSSRQFKEENFSQTVLNIIRESGVRPGSVELELTESILIGNTSDILSVLNTFKQAGIRLSIDDFGTGYSSLSYLKLFPIDKVKIDQSFTKNAAVNESDRSLVKAVIAMSRALSLATIAEGVETQEQFDLMETEGCDAIQGYHIAKPLTGEAFETFLLSHTADKR